MKRVALLIVIMALLAAQAFGDMRREVSIWVARDVAPGPKVRLTINTRNVAVVRMAAHRLHDVQTLINREDLVKRPAVSGRPVSGASTS